SLSGISNGTMNVFMTVMEYLERNRGLYISRETGLPVTENLSFLFNLDSLDFKKELIERQAFISDLVTRNICPQVHLTTLSAPEAGGNNLTISQTSRVIYRYMKQAKAFLNA
ncbi:MAG TPA: hypothetical protein VHP58_00945, partial [Alphaproteobacteria bacterium]|nr:hypothetical protein [Alphaproteobacteria bacterium]